MVGFKCEIIPHIYSYWIFKMSNSENRSIYFETHSDKIELRHTKFNTNSLVQSVCWCYLFFSLFSIFSSILLSFFLIVPAKISPNESVFLIIRITTNSVRLHVRFSNRKCHFDFITCPNIIFPPFQW